MTAGQIERLQRKYDKAIREGRRFEALTLWARLEAEQRAAAMGETEIAYAWGK